MTPRQGVDFNLKPVNWINFDKACRLSQINNVSTVLFTGKGEPTLYPDQLTEFLKNMKKFDFPIVEIQTNGIVFGSEWKKYESYLKKWRELGLNTIAFSVAHYERERNREIYTPNGEYYDLPDVIKKLHTLGYSIRLSCIMLKGYVDSVNEVKRFIEKAKEWEVEQLTIRGVNVPNKSEDKDIYDWTIKRILTKGQIIDISEFLNKEGNKLMTLDHGGIVYDYNGQNVCLSDCLTIKPNTEDLRQLIFFPDGHLRYDWQYKGAVLL
jgi:molybdenum cofactor biosynthesis enzyme MoaA